MPVAESCVMMKGNSRRRDGCAVLEEALENGWRLVNGADDLLGPLLSLETAHLKQQKPILKPKSAREGRAKTVPVPNHPTSSRPLQRWRFGRPLHFAVAHRSALRRNPSLEALGARIHTDSAQNPTALTWRSRLGAWAAWVSGVSRAQRFKLESESKKCTRYVCHVETKILSPIRWYDGFHWLASIAVAADTCSLSSKGLPAEMKQGKHLDIYLDSGLSLFSLLCFIKSTFPVPTFKFPI